MRILFANDGIGDAGGVQTYLAAVMPALAARGHSVALLHLDPLRGARETIRAAGPGLVLLVEMHPTVWRETGLSRHELEAELALQGLRAEPLRPVADPWALEGECLRLVRQ